MSIEGYFLGKTARAKHPITVLNPEPTFIIKYVKVDYLHDGHVVSVRGDDTCWFGKNSWELVNI